MITGALASSYYGQPRTTMDIDIVLRVSGKEFPRLFNSLAKAKLEVHPEKVNTSLKAGYNILSFKDSKSSHSVDIILSKKSLQRKPGSILDLRTYYQTPEDLILSKLRMIKVTIEPERAMKDRQDIKTILRTTKVNLKDIRSSASRETTLELLKELLE